MNQNHEILLLTFLYGTTFLFVLPSVCQNLGFSKYFVPSNAEKTKIDHENDARVTRAKQTLHNFESRRFREVFSERRRRRILDFGIVVLSVRRRSDPHYLLQSGVRLMREVQRDGGNSEMIIFNADKNPALNEDAKILSRFVKVVNQSISERLVSYDVFESQKLDYMTALQYGLQLRSRYLLVIEDDALASNRILEKLRYVLKRKMPWKGLSSASRKWAFLKLYYPEKWQGYSNSEIPELILIGVLGALCFTVFREKILKTRRDHLSERMWWVWCLSGCLYFVLVAYTVGRAHWIEMRKGLPILYSVGNAPGCCIPAVVFPNEQARNLARFLNDTKCRNGYPLILHSRTSQRAKDLLACWFLLIYLIISYFIQAYIRLTRILKNSSYFLDRSVIRLLPI